jgi:tetratricopeptide (TPR) repeat protein
MAPVTPENHYWQAYLQHKLGKDSGDLLKKAQTISPALSFPYRSETAEVFQWVISQDNSWKPKYYLGLIHWNRNDTTQAKELFNACAFAPDFAPFYLARAELFLQSNPKQALNDYLEAEKLDPKQWRTGLILSQFYARQKLFDKAQQYARKYYQRFPQSYILGSQYAKTLLLSGQYEASLKVLNKLKILPYEGSTEGRSLYKEANLMLATQAISAGKPKEALKHIAQSRIWNENLGAGKPYVEDIDERMEDYMEALAYEKLGKKEQAVTLYNKIVAYKDSGSAFNNLFTALSLRRTGKEAQAHEFMSNWLKKSPDSPLARWSYAWFKGENPPIPTEIAGNDNLRLLVKFYESLKRV